MIADVDLLQDAAKAAMLVRMQVELEYRLDARDRLVPFPGLEEQARYIVYRIADGYLRWFRYDLAEDMAANLAATPAQWAFEQPERVISSLSGLQVMEPVVTPRFVSGYLPCCPETLEFPDVEYEPGMGVVLRQDKAVVASAFSVRQNARCAEVAVETVAAYRQRGYARQVTAAWAYRVITEGKQAFYSYKDGNLASAALAASLGVVIYAEVVAFE